MVTLQVYIEAPSTEIKTASYHEGNIKIVDVKGGFFITDMPLIKSAIDHHPFDKEDWYQITLKRQEEEFDSGLENGQHLREWYEIIELHRLDLSKDSVA